MAVDRFVSREEIAFLLDVDVKTITNWVKKHPEFPSRVRGRERDFPVQRCLRWKRDRDVADAVASLAPPAPSGLADAEERLAIAQAELAEIKVAKAKAEVMLVAQAAKEIRETFGRMRASATAKPGEFAPQILHLESLPDAVTKLRQLVDDILSEWQMSAGGSSADDEDDDEEGDES